jgi:hypothetical protein
MLHGDDPRLPRVFHAGRDLIRFERKWVTNAGETYTKDVGPIVRTLPVCLFINSKGKLQADEEIEARFAQPIDLTGYGYPALTPVWGVRIYGHRLTVSDPNRIPVVVQQKALAPECMEAFRPRYVPVDQRELDEAAAWETLEEVFPKLHREAVKLLVAAKGVAEGEVGLPPMMFFSGPTGAAKTGTITVAAAICGDTNHSVPWANNVERLRQAILEGKDQGSFITFNEIVKDSKEGGKSLAKSLDFLLNITPDSMSHKLYVGPVQLGALPCVLPHRHDAAHRDQAARTVSETTRPYPPAPAGEVGGKHPGQRAQQDRALTHRGPPILRGLQRDPLRRHGFVLYRPHDL